MGQRMKDVKGIRKKTTVRCPSCKHTTELKQYHYNPLPSNCPKCGKKVKLVKI